MPDYAKKIVYLSEAQYQELITNKTITVNETTIDYDDNTIYLTPQNSPLYSTDLAEWAKAANKPTYTAQEVGALPSSTKIPTKVSELTNDSGFLTEHQDLSDKADKTDTVLLTTLSRGRKEGSTVGDYSFAFGNDVIASGAGSHAEGGTTTASGYLSHAEGGGTTASGYVSHAEGAGTTASGQESHAEGASTTASGDFSHSEGVGTVASMLAQHVFGEYNTYEDNNGNSATKGQYIEIVGNGTTTSNTSNARALDWNGNEKLAGDVYVHANTDSSGGSKLITADDVPVKDVKINGVSVLNNGLANIPIAGANEFGVLSTNGLYGLGIENGILKITSAPESVIKPIYNNASETMQQRMTYRPITARYLNEAVFYGLAKAAGDTTQSQSNNAIGTYTSEAKAAIRSMIGAENSQDTTETITDTSPTIVCEENHRYICGEVSSINITPCAVGICDIVFTSGSSAAVLTVPNTIKWPVWFDPSNLSTNTIYELNIMDGIYGAVITWI